MGRDHRLFRRFTATAAIFGLFSAFDAQEARAQQNTFKLDRLEVPGAPDDGLVLFRPTSSQKGAVNGSGVSDVFNAASRSIVFGQLALGYQLEPLHTRNITEDPDTLRRSSSSVITHTINVYMNAGFELFDRFIIGVAFPFAPYQNGQNPDYGNTTILGSTKTTTVITNSANAGDVRLDLRGWFWRSDDRATAFGAGASLFAPSGSKTTFGGDGDTGGMLMLTGEHTVKNITIVANTGIAFRPHNSINDPVAKSGLGIGDEWRWAVGAFYPFKDGKYRVGATIFGQTGIEDDSKDSSPIIGNTIFQKRNTPVEYDFEGRMRFGTVDRMWAGASVGSFINNGYGAPDLRITALVGIYTPIIDTNPESPKRALREKWRSEHVGDRDGDGIPDDIDACPDEPEDHLGNDPSDGCPIPKDRDGDGIPDSVDKCPDQPEDKDGVDDEDGCPEDDQDKDGIPDAQDACPKVPGKPNPDPKKNGCPLVTLEGEGLRVLDQIHFAFGSATILPDSFPTLQAVANVLTQYPGIKRMSIDGHTDNRGSAVLNKQLSQSRANSVMKWLTDHGIKPDRLEAHGYGLEKPIADNNTDEGRQINRRVEFRILQEDK
jgi:outer membrane protein OmpA-like peptidoglycan-associated protein